ncbi:sulfatase-like hydrolase/transferase [Membranihabitans maritimus]|uniref:sulfatase-like hydrolase/transferase n=1 Tax=Membranihabitans maritimus TaxID=2904244 RepID=UPI001F01A1E6|nr:sulfatase-like hydrolase/transferase [Membranihabitans maritimus]
MKINLLCKCFHALSMVFFFSISVSSCSDPNSGKDVPNIIVFMIDDLGYGDIGAYNDSIDYTPHIDSLAIEGMMWTDFHSNGPMCSPTRAAFLTGQYQYRFGKRFEHALSARRKDSGLPDTVVTIADVLKRKGYKTGMFGKWHLGIEEPYLPNNYGFDIFQGLLSGDGDHHTHINRWGMEDWWSNKKLDMNQEYSVDRITKGTVQFIKENNNDPFFLYVSHLAIHFPWQGPGDPTHRMRGGDYTDDKWGIIPDKTNVRPHVEDMIKAVDESVGEIMASLKSQLLDKNTIVIFTSDNGGYRHYDYRFFNISNNGPLRGQKAEVLEGGHRVPFIIWWPDKIDPGEKTFELGMSMDLFPTLAAIVEAELPEYGTDGIDLSPVLFEKGKTMENRTVFWKMGDDWAVREGKWKLINMEGKKSLYNLQEDIGESNDKIDTQPVKRDLLNKEYNQMVRNILLY